MPKLITIRQRAVGVKPRRATLATPICGYDTPICLGLLRNFHGFGWLPVQNCANSCMTRGCREKNDQTNSNGERNASFQRSGGQRWAVPPDVKVAWRLGECVWVRGADRLF